MDTKQAKLQITVVHFMPGRLRLNLSLPPTAPHKTEYNIKRHEGVQSVSYTLQTGNLLIYFDESKVTFEEIILRASMSLSVDHNLRSVFIKTSNTKVSLGVLSLFSGISILTGHIITAIAPGSKALPALEIICGLGTTAAIGEHIWQDFKNKDQFHPEVLSVAFLLSSFLRKRVLKSASVAWSMTFARHLVEPPSQILKLDVSRKDSTSDVKQCEYEAKVSKEYFHKGYTGFLSRLPQLLFDIYADMLPAAEDHVFKEIKKLSREHDDVLEGLEKLQDGIFLQVEH